MTSIQRGPGRPRHFPVVRRTGGDPRFSVGLVVDIAALIEQAGFPDVLGGDLVELHAALAVFVYGKRTEGPIELLRRTQQ